MPESYTKKSAGRISFMSTSVNAAGASAYEAGYTTVTTGGFSYSNQLDGVKNPHWADQVSRGQDASTPMTATEVTVIERTSGHLEVSGNVGTVSAGPAQRRKSGVKGDIVTLSSAPLMGNPPVAAARNMAAGRFYAKIRDANSTFKGMVAIGEGAQSLRMIHSRGGQILQLISTYILRLKRAKKKHIRRKDRRKALADNYLEFVFGVLPLASDIEDAYDAATRIRPVRKWIKGLGGESSPEGSPIYGAFASGVLRYQTLVTNRSWAKCQYTTMLALEQGILGRVNGDFGLNVREFVPTLWEVLPWSFLYDYFGNLNEVINAGCYASLIRGSVNLTVTQGSETTATAFGASQSGSINFELNVTNQPSKIKVQRKVVTRSCDVGHPMVFPAFKLPDSPKKALNMVALYASRKFQYWP